MQSNVVSLRPEDDLGRYLDQARRHPMLTPEHELELARRWRDTQDADAARQLVASHLRLVIKLARGYGGYGFPLSELVAEALGLAQALTKFDPDRGFRFATYAMWWIRAAMQEHILHNWSMVKLGTTAAQKKLFFNLRRLKGRLGETGSGDLPAGAVASIAHDLAVETGEVIEMNRRLRVVMPLSTCASARMATTSGATCWSTSGRTRSATSPRRANWPGATTCCRAPWTFSTRASGTS